MRSRWRSFGAVIMQMELGSAAAESVTHSRSTATGDVAIRDAGSALPRCDLSGAFYSDASPSMCLSASMGALAAFLLLLPARSRGDRFDEISFTPNSARLSARLSHVQLPTAAAADLFGEWSPNPTVPLLTHLPRRSHAAEAREAASRRRVKHAVSALVPRISSMNHSNQPPK